MTLVQWDVTRGSSQQSSEEKMVMSTGNSPRMNTRAVSQDLMNGIISIFFSYLLWLPATKTLESEV